MKYIDCTPTWSGILPALLLILKDGETEESKQFARDELGRMAKLADQYNKLAKGKSK